MKRFALLLLATFITFGLRANTLRYTFNSEPLAKALTRVADDHPELNINFIYNELDRVILPVGRVGQCQLERLLKREQHIQSWLGDGSDGRGDSADDKLYGQLRP